ncbi:PREDICTED: putative odorant receptor 85d [Rhagoletis zephyria]|uniref:putative odorant receptor 85d n=1 Tax=Rhagoletis zephyria TaxID=28612 RepID=UPI0008115505|nr:PREDICTED: putative odorant receptor 85d [Rhagoletis zephyria]
MSNKPIHFESFFYKAKIFFNCIGVNAYDKVSNEPRRGKLALVRRHLQRIIFTVTIVNLNLTLLSVLIQIFLDIVNNNNFIEATMLGSIGNALIISELKIFSIWWQRSRISSLMQELYALYPQTLGGQMLYQVKAELKNWNRLGNAYIMLNVLLVWSNTLWPLISYLIFEYWLELRKVGKMLSFNCWTPFVWCDNWLYYPMYLSQLTVAHACISTQLANDLLFSAVAVQLIMHYRQLAKRIESYVVAESGGNEMKKRRLSDLERSEIDLRFLHGIIAYHQKILTFV